MPLPSRMTITQARRSFATVLARARSGVEVEITSRGEVVARVTPVAASPRPNRVFGSDRGRIRMADDFDAPLDDFDAYVP